MQAFAEKKMLKHNRARSIHLSKGRKLCGKSKKCLCGKWFQCSVFSNLSEFNTLNGDLTSDNAQDRQPELNLIQEEMGRKTFKERERERWEKRYLWTIYQNIKMGFLNIPLASSLFCPC